MRKVFGLAVAAIALLPVAGISQEDAATVVAKVNGQELTIEDLRRSYAGLPEQYRQAPMEMVFEPLLERLIDSELVLEDAQGLALADDPDVAAAIEEARANVLREAAVRRAMEAAMTDEALQAAYEAKKAAPDFAYEEVRARHILVEDEATAQGLIEQLDGGADFAELAKANSTGPSGPNGGDLGFFQRDAMVPEFGDVAFTLEPGSYTETPVKTQFGYHVILVEERRMTEPSFEDTEPQIREEISQATLTAYLDGLRQDAEIERFNLDGSPRQE